MLDVTIICKLFILLEFYLHTSSALIAINTHKTLVWGPGLDPDFFVPARYFFIQPVDKDGNK